MIVCPSVPLIRDGEKAGKRVEIRARDVPPFLPKQIGGVRRKLSEVGAKGGKEEWTKAGGWKAEFPRFVQIPTNMRLFPYLVLSSYMSCTARERSSEKGSGLNRNSYSGQ